MILDTVTAVRCIAEPFYSNWSTWGYMHTPYSTFQNPPLSSILSYLQPSLPSSSCQDLSSIFGPLISYFLLFFFLHLVPFFFHKVNPLWSSYWYKRRSLMKAPAERWATYCSAHQMFHWLIHPFCRVLFLVIRTKRIPQCLFIRITVTSVVSVFDIAVQFL